MKNDLLSLVLPRVRALTAYHLDPHEAPIKLDQNENSTGLPEPIRKEIERRLGNLSGLPLHRYPEPTERRLREALAEASGWSADGILIDNGSDQLLHTFARAVLEPGRVAVAPSPTFFAYSHAALISGADLVEVPLDEAYRYDVSALLAAVAKHRPHVLFLCSPNNPTGCDLTPSDLERLVSEAPGLVVLDEAYWEFTGWNALDLLRDHSNLLLFRTFSKALALAGGRIGYVLLDPDLRNELVKVQPPYRVNRFAREAALVVLEHYDLAHARARAIVKEKDAFYESLRRVDGLEVFPSSANFLLVRSRRGGEATYRGLLDRGIVVRNVGGHPLLRDCLRISVGTAEENRAVVEAIRDVVTR